MVSRKIAYFREHSSSRNFEIQTVSLKSRRSSHWSKTVRHVPINFVLVVKAKKIIFKRNFVIDLNHDVSCNCRFPIVKIRCWTSHFLIDRIQHQSRLFITLTAWVRVLSNCWSDRFRVHTSALKTRTHSVEWIYSTAIMGCFHYHFNKP